MFSIIRCRLSLPPPPSQIYYLGNDLYSCGIGSVKAALTCQACWVGSDWAALFVFTLQTGWHAGDFFFFFLSVFHSFGVLQHAKTLPPKKQHLLQHSQSGSWNICTAIKRLKERRGSAASIVHTLNKLCIKKRLLCFIAEGGLPVAWISNKVAPPSGQECYETSHSLWSWAVKQNEVNLFSTAELTRVSAFFF